MIDVLEPVYPVEADPDNPGADDDHPMRVVTRQVAFEPESWTAERRDGLAELFDVLSAEWHTRDRPGRFLPLADALTRGDVPRGTALEPGSGIGLATPMLADHFRHVVALELSGEMIARSPRSNPMVRADGAELPVPAGSIDAVILMNMLLFPAELDRVLTPAGVVVWVNSHGDRTPIHLAAEDVARALPGSWHGVSSAAGFGTWAVVRRA